MAYSIALNSIYNKEFAINGYSPLKLGYQNIKKLFFQILTSYPLFQKNINNVASIFSYYFSYIVFYG